MKALILAAGRGSRLEPLTADRPKGCLEFFGKTLIERQIELYRNLGIEDIHIVGGYRSESLTFPGTTLWKNERWQETNMVHSLFCARDILNGDVILSYADIVFETRLLQSLIDCEESIRVVVDRKWQSYYEKRFDGQGDAESLKLDSNDHLLEIGNPSPALSDIEAQYMGLIGLNDKGCQTFIDTFTDLNSQSLEGPWRNSRSFDQAYMTDFIQEVIDRNHVVQGVTVDHGWLEFDTLEDVNRYSSWAQDKTLKPFCDLKVYP